MKKTVKSLIIAASVAAIAGIGAVSFAAWQGGTASQETAGSMGKVTNFLTLGTPTTTAITDLLPYDQLGTADLQTTTAKTLGQLTYAVTLEDGYDAYTVTVKAEPKTGDTAATFGSTGSGDTEKHTVLYASLTAPVAAIEDTTGWNDITGTNGYTFTAKQQGATLNVYLILDSNDNDQMEKEFNITVTIEKANA